MSDLRFVLDTNAVIFLVTRGNAIPSALLDELNNADLFVSVITEIELFANPALDPGEGEKLHALLSDSIQKIELTNAVKKETISLRRTTELKLPDCVVAASALALSAVLLTDDTDLLRLDWPGYKAKSLN